MFEILAKAKAGALYKLLSRLPIDEAAIVLTRVPNPLAIQVIAHYPAETQAEIGPAMVDARWAEPGKIETVEEKIRSMLQQAKRNLAAQSGAPEENAPPPPAPPPRGLVERQRPGAPVARPSSPPFGKAGNPYRAAAESSPPPPAPPAEKPGLAARAKELAKNMMRPPASAAKRKNEGPQPWTPRQATSSPINGPAVPGATPPVAGDPFASPLARAGLLDLIGRAQEKFLPKGAPPPAVPPPAQRLKLGKNGRPEPLEGLLAPGDVKLVKTPRVIGPKGGSAAAKTPEKGARRMDGQAILAAILRESDSSLRGMVRRDDPALFKQLREKMFFFDDLVLTDDNALARVFTAAPTEESALALKFAAPALRDKVLRSVSPGRARALREHAGGRAGVDAIEKAQQTVLDVALQLQSAGRILIDPRDPDLAGK